MEILNFKFSTTGDALDIWVKVPEGTEYTKVLIDKIAIQDSKSYTSSYPATPQFEMTPTSLVYTITNKKEVKLSIPIKDLIKLHLLNTGLYFIYIHQSGESTNPSLCDKETTITGAAYLYPIYNEAIKLLAKDVTNKCNKENLIDIYLKKQMFIESINLEEFITAIDIYNNLLVMEINKGNCLDTINNTSLLISNTPSTGCKSCS